MSHQTEPGSFARWLRNRLPAGGLFADRHWRMAPEPFPLGKELAAALERLGRILLQFYKAVNLLYRQSVQGKQPSWVAHWLDLGKPREVVEMQRSPAFRNEWPRVIRPDILLTEEGWVITELDSVPGGIGLTAWLNLAYSERPDKLVPKQPAPVVIGGAQGMLHGFSGIFGDAARIHLVVSEEAATYRPEMVWLAGQLGRDRFHVHNQHFTGFRLGDAVYRFFELFDVPNVPCAQALFQAAMDGTVRLTPPPKPIFEEKMLFGLLWNRNLESFWRRELGESFFQRLREVVPYTWVVDPSPLPPHAAVPELGLTDWRQLKDLSQRNRQLVLKISGFSELAWGARGVHLGSDLSQAEWSAAVDQALAGFLNAPYVLQRFHKPRLVETQGYHDDHPHPKPMAGRVRLCPYYFVDGQGDHARAKLGGILATICPADKKIIHGMSDAILAPACV